MPNLYIILIVFFFFQTILSSHLFPHIVWLYWNTGYKGLGGYQKMCFGRVKTLHEKTDWDVRLLDRDSIDRWLNKTNYEQLEQFLDPKLNVTEQTRANFIRYYLLKQHGGVWLDVSVILFQNLNWLDNLLQNPRVIHKNIFKRPQVFLFYKHQGIFQQQKRTIQYNGQNIYPLLDVQNAFIAAVKQSKFIIDLISQYKNLVRAEDSKYYFNQRRKFYFPYLYNEYFRAFLANNIIQYKKFSTYQNSFYQKKHFDIQSQFYGILTMNRKTQMYHLTQAVNRMYFAFESQGFRGDYAHYFTKYHHFGTQQMVKHVLNANKSQIQKSQIVIDARNYEVGQMLIRPEKECLYQLKVNEYSVLNKYLLSNNIHLTHETYPNFQLVKYSELPLICKITTLRTIRKTFLVLLLWIKNVIIFYLIAQFVLQYYISFFKSSQIFLRPYKNQEQFKQNMFQKLILFVAMYLQTDLIYYQYQLWLEESPIAVIVAVFQLGITIFMFFWMVNGKKMQFLQKVLKFNIFEICFCLLMLLQYFIQYHFTVWNYQGQIYNYQVLTQLNHQNLQQGEIHLMKTLSMIILKLLIKLLKFIFGIQNNKKKKKDKNQMPNISLHQDGYLYPKHRSEQDNSLNHMQQDENKQSSNEQEQFLNTYSQIPKQQQQNYHKQIVLL